MLVDGKWTEAWQPVQATDKLGGFVRQISTFRNWVTPDGAPGPTGRGGFEADVNRYHLYVALICPWASRTLIARALKGLESLVSLSIVEPVLSDEGWRFGPQLTDRPNPVDGVTYLHEIYTRSEPRCTGRATVPVLWDRRTGVIVNNESADILRMFNAGFGDLASSALDLRPDDLADGIDELNESIYSRLNNGVYRAGFATTQEAYDLAYNDVFAALDEVEARMETGGKYLFGDRFTEADIRLFVTLVRFDVAYFSLFKCNARRLMDYPHLQSYMLRILDDPKVRATVNVDHIKRG